MLPSAGTAGTLCHATRLGYGLSGGRGWVWACLPFLDEAGDGVAITWWGDAPEFRPDRTVAFIKLNESPDPGAHLE